MYYGTYELQSNRKKYECVKEITKELRKTFKGIQSNSYGYCCNSDYDADHNYRNDDDYVCAKIFKGGLNNDYDSRRGQFILGSLVYFLWGLKEFELNDVIQVMTSVANNYGYKIVPPCDKTKCIELIFEEN